jgi:tRNA threonylcarbamoyladenosine biosynthesis protein TsaB
MLPAPGESALYHQRFLILESSHAPGFVAVAEGAKVLALRQLDEARRHARDLAPAAGALLTQVAWKPKDVSAVVVSVGPGSYTGLRIGIMSAKAFCYATGSALIAVETFEAIARQAPAEISQLAVIADAQQNNIYVQEFARSGEAATWQMTVPLQIEDGLAWASRPGRPAWASGPGLARWEGRLGGAVQVVDRQLWLPGAEVLAAMAVERAGRGEWSDMWTVEPIYLRPSAAEEQWARRKGG